MTRPSDNLDDLTSDLRHLVTLISTITDIAIDIVDPDKEQCERTKAEVTRVADLLWIARDIAETVADNSSAAHCRVLAERSTCRMVGGDRNA